MDKALQAAIDAAKKKNVSTLVVASTSGKTADRLLSCQKARN